MKMHRISKLIIVVMFCLSFCSLTFANQLVIITNKAVTDDLSKEKIIAIYKNKFKNWTDGTKVKVGMLKTGETHNSFTKQFMKISAKSFFNIWKRIIFTGRGSAPIIFKTEEALVDFVSNNRGAIGYVDNNTNRVDVKEFIIE